MDSIGQRLKHARELRRLSQPGLAKRAGVSQGTVGNIEADIRRGSASSVHKLAVALRVRPEWLLDGTGQMDLSDPYHLSPEALEIALGLDRLTGAARRRALAVCRLEALGDPEEVSESEEEQTQPDRTTAPRARAK